MQTMREKKLLNMIFSFPSVFILFLVVFMFLFFPSCKQDEDNNASESVDFGFENDIYYCVKGTSIDLKLQGSKSSFSYDSSDYNSADNGTGVFKIYADTVKKFSDNHTVWAEIEPEQVGFVNLVGKQTFRFIAENTGVCTFKVRHALDKYGRYENAECKIIVVGVIVKNFDDYMKNREENKNILYADNIEATGNIAAITADFLPNGKDSDGTPYSFGNGVEYSLNSEEYIAISTEGTDKRIQIKSRPDTETSVLLTITPKDVTNEAVKALDTKTIIRFVLKP